MKPSSFATDDSELTLDWLARCVGTRRASDPAHLDALVGVLMLDTGFKRFPRDIGSSDSLPFATLQYRVESAVVGEVVTAHALRKAPRRETPRRCHPGVHQSCALASRRRARVQGTGGRSY